MSKFEVGDKIKLIVNVGPSRDDGVKGGVEKGDILTCVDKAEPLEGYRLGNGEVSCEWANKYKSYFEEKKQMKKGDLKSGMHVELRNGHTYIVLTDGWNGSFCLILIGAVGWASDCWDENLTSRSDSVLDIVKVYQPPIYNIMEIDNSRKLLWKREEKTPEQIQLEVVMDRIAELQKQAQQLQELINK